MSKVDLVEAIKTKYECFSPYLNEKTRRIWAAIEAKALGRGGVSQVSLATRLSRTTIYVGLKQLENQNQLANPEKIRSPGGGRKLVEEIDLTLVKDLEFLIEPTTLGDPESALRWTSKSGVKLANELQTMGHKVSSRTVHTLLGWLGYSLQANRKTLAGSSHQDRDAQFLYINQIVEQFQNLGQPAISVDTKKKELIGEFKNPGQEWQLQEEPVEVRIHDFVDPKLGKAIPYGIYDLTLNKGWVSIGIDHDTAEFAVESIRHWWLKMGQPLYPDSKHLLLTADCGGSNGYRTKLWKLRLQDLADETGLTIHVCHFPPGTSKWNKIEHRMFCHITTNWRGKPLTSLQVVINLITHTTTNNGLEIQAVLDENHYPTGIEVSPEDFNSIAIERHAFHGEWNYQIKPRTTT
ncbi:ISAzo13 family transposase [Nostoc sp. NIES-2111]